MRLGLRYLLRGGWVLLLGGAAVTALLEPDRPSVLAPLFMLALPWSLPLLLVLMGLGLAQSPAVEIVALLCAILNLGLLGWYARRLRARAPETFLRVSAAALLLVLLWSYSGAWSLESALTEEQFASPSGTWIAAHYRTQEKSQVPYGTRITVQEWWRRWLPYGSRSAPVVFLGHCHSLSVEWRSDEQLLVGCGRVEDVVLQRSRVRSISVQYEVTRFSSFWRTSTIECLQAAQGDLL